MSLNALKRGINSPVEKAAVSSKNHLSDLLENLYGNVERDVNPLQRIYCDRGRHLHADALGLTSYISMYYYKKSKGNAHMWMRKGERLAKEVHEVLGRQRIINKDNNIPDRLGLSDADQPLLGGLRSGNAMGENRPMGDGQHWYQICLWAFALNRLAVASDNPRYNELASQLMIVSGRKFIQQTISDGDHQDGVRQSIHTLSPRMSIELDTALPFQDRPTNPLVGALVCGILKNSFGPDGDSKIIKSLTVMEKRLLSIWEQYSDDDSIRSNPSLIGDLLWAGTWAHKSKWGANALQTGSEYLTTIITQSEPLHKQPFSTRYVPGELWMIALSKGLTHTNIKTHHIELLDQLFDANKIRISMWGIMGQVCVELL